MGFLYSLKNVCLVLRLLSGVSSLTMCYILLDGIHLIPNYVTLTQKNVSFAGEWGRSNRSLMDP